jgi:hypothetical protein
VRRGGRFVACAWLSASLVLWGGQARASESQVTLELRACAALSESTLREHLELELATLGLAQVQARLLLVCEPNAVAIELFRQSGESYPVQVRVALGDTAKAARERLVALAATELVAQAERARQNEPKGRAQPQLPSEPSSQAELRSADRARAAPPPRRRPRVELFVAGNAALDGAPRTALWGGTLGTSWGVTPTWSVLLDTRFERGEGSMRLADVRWTLLSGFAGAGLSVSAGPTLLSAGFGVRAGWLALAASSRSPYEGLSFTAPWAGVAVPVRVAFDVGGFVSPFVGAELGYVLAPVHGKVSDGSMLVEQRGPWLAGSVGVAVAL